MGFTLLLNYEVRKAVRLFTLKFNRKGRNDFFYYSVINKVRKALWLFIKILLKLQIFCALEISFNKSMFCLHETALGMEAVSFCDTLNFWQSLTLQPLSQKI